MLNPVDQKWHMPEQHKINVDYYTAEYYLKMSLGLLNKCKEKFYSEGYTAISRQIEQHLRQFRKTNKIYE